MTQKKIWLNLGGLGLLIALLGLVYWLNTGARAVPGLIEDLQSGDLQAQMLAAEGLKEIGSNAQPAVPVLVAIATSDSNLSLSGAAAGALPAIDLSAARQVIAAWLPKFHDPDAQIRGYAASTIGAIGPVAKPAVSIVVRLLSDEDIAVRERATRALGSIGLPIDVVMGGLLQALHDPEWTVRYAAVTQFSFNGFSSQESLAALRDLTQDSNQTVAGLAQSAVATAERLIQASVYSLMLSQGMNRTYTLHQLAKLGPRAADAVSGIATVLTAEKPLERYLAASALEEIGPTAKESAPALQRALHDTDPIVREAVLAALQSIENKRDQTP
jgi:HEAT repeat protein